MGLRGFSEGINLTVVVFIMAAPSVQEDERSVESDREMGVAPNVGSFTSFLLHPMLGASENNGEEWLAGHLELVV